MLRLRLGNEQPIAIENTYILHDCIPDIENIDFQIYSLYDLFRTNNIKIHDISHAFSTTKVHNTDARFLNLENDTSVIYVDINIRKFLYGLNSANIIRMAFSKTVFIK